jgi:murein DD-endopeptidase MepM/ murein hydrolase activator NlpD
VNPARPAGEDPGGGWTVLLIPDRGAEHARQLRVTGLRLRQLRLGAAGLLAGIVLTAAAFSLFLPRIWSYPDIADENLALRERLQAIDRQLDEVDDALRRLRLYDSQIRFLARGADLPGYGPVDEEEEQHWKELWGGAGDPDGDLPPDGTSAPGFEEPGSPGVGAADLRPAELWAQAVETRAAQLSGLVDELEPHMSAMVQDLEDWRSYRSALPASWPAYGMLTSEFGYRRSPFSRRWKFHSGVDIAAPRGTPIYAVAAGVVSFAGYNSGYGRMIEIDHGHGVRSRYAHNTSHFVQEGDVIDVGERIATIGSTGRATGPHLHFEVLIDDQQVDPIEYLP